MSAVGTMLGGDDEAVRRAVSRRELPTGNLDPSRDPLDRPLTLKSARLDDPPATGGPILPVGGTAIDEFDARMAAWLADVAMNDQGA
jgi:hypothetical protein